MAQRPGSGDGPSAVLTELKGVAAAYPLYGTLMLKRGPAGTLAADEVVIGQGLAERLALQPGQHLRYGNADFRIRSEEHTSELQSLMRISYAVLCLQNQTDAQILTKQLINTAYT